MARISLALLCGCLWSGTVLAQETVVLDEATATPVGPSPVNGWVPNHAGPVAGCDPVAGGCEVGCCRRWPTWTGGAGWLYLKRDGGVGNGNLIRRQFQSFIPNPPTVTQNILAFEDFGDFDYESGVQVELSRHLGPCTALTARYAWLGEHTAQAAAGPVNPVFAPTDGIFLRTMPQTDISAASFVNNVIQAQYSSDYQSFEFLLEREVVPGIELHGGFRYVAFDERLGIGVNSVGVAIPQASSYAFDTENDLYGFQVGADGAIWQVCDWFSIDGLAHAGVYNNEAKSQVTGTRTATNGSTAGMSRASQVAFLGEVGLFGTIRTCRGVTVRAGYQVMWIEGLALAGAQVGNTGNVNTNQPMTPTSIDSNDGVLYHGVNLLVTVPF